VQERERAELDAGRFERPWLQRSLARWQHSGRYGSTGLRDLVLLHRQLLHHDNYIGTPFGPNPKATFLGDLANLPSCSRECGCTYTRGYWTSKPGVEWPAPYDRNASFFSSGLTWQQVLTTPASGNGYIILGAQYIAAVLNVANKACHPDGVQDILDQSESFFNGTTTPSAACPSPSSCGLQKSWATILDNYNNGLYPGGPAHCGDE
jgi:hypothetical protein